MRELVSIISFFENVPFSKGYKNSKRFFILAVFKRNKLSVEQLYGQFRLSAFSNFHATRLKFYVREGKPLKLSQVR